MNLKDVEKAFNALEAARAHLKTLRENRDKINLNVRSQDRITVFVNNVGIELTVFDRNYTSVLLRGREMIALGVAKALNEMIDAAVARVAEHEAYVRKLVSQ